MTRTSFRNKTSRRSNSELKDLRRCTRSGVIVAESYSTIASATRVKLAARKIARDPTKLKNEAAVKTGRETKHVEEEGGAVVGRKEEFRARDEEETKKGGKLERR